MKLLKSTLFIIALLMIQPVSARELAKSGRAAGTTSKKAPARTTRSRGRTTQAGPAASEVAPTGESNFQSLMQKVRSMKPADVINNEGMFTDNFKDFVKSSELAPELMEALMQAGRNLHLPLLGNNNQDLATMDYAQDNINRLMTQYVTTAPVEIPEFYNPRINLFNQDYLDEYVASKNVTQGSQKDAEKMIIDELIPKITEVWAKRNISATPSQIDAAERQILRTIDKEFRKGAKPGIIQRPKTQVPATPTAQASVTPAFYNSKTDLFDQDYLDRYISSNASLTTIPQKDAERMAIGDLMPKITDVWKKRSIPMSITQVDTARGQIIRSIEKEFKKWGKPQAAGSQKEWYDGWTQLLTTQYLDRFVGDALQFKKPKRQYENELEALEKQVKSEWEKENITPQQKDALAPLLNKQLEETANAIEQKRTLKREVMNELDIRAKKINTQPEEKAQSIPTKQPVGASNDFELYIKNLTSKNESEVLAALFARQRSGFYQFKDQGSKSLQMITDMQEHLENEFPQISPAQISDAITYGIRAGLNVKLSPDAAPLKRFVSSIINGQNPQVLIKRNTASELAITTPEEEYALILGRDKYADEIKSLFKMGAGGTMTLDTSKKDFQSLLNDVLKNLVIDIRSQFPNITTVGLYKVVQTPLTTYFDKNAPLSEYNIITDALNDIV